MGMSSYVMDKQDEIEERCILQACEYAWANGYDKDSGLLWAEENWDKFLTQSERELFE